MSYIFVLLFLAAVVGIIRPFIKGAKRSHFVIAAVVSFILVGVFAPKSTSDAKDDTATSSENVASGNQAAPAQNPSEQLASNWEYSDTRDEMRGTTSKLASVQSDNAVDLDFPYGEVHGELWIRRRAEDGLSVAFQVEKGQVLCHSFSDDYVSLKFDAGPIQKFRCTSSSDGSTETAFIEDAGRALSALKRAKRTIVEAEFYQKGRQQFIFDTAGLQWK